MILGPVARGVRADLRLVGRVFRRDTDPSNGTRQGRSAKTEAALQTGDLEHLCG